MKIYGSIALLFLFQLMSAQHVEFRVQFSEPLAVFQFVNSIKENVFPNEYKKVFDSSKYNTDQRRSILSKFQSVNYIYWYEYDQYPYGSKIGGSSYFLLLKNLIESKSIEEFEYKSEGIIPESDLLVLKNTLAEFVPVYRALILEPGKKQLEAQLAAFSKKIQETDIGTYTRQIGNFHRSSWNTSRPFILNICPAPPGDNIQATAFFHYAYLMLPSNKDDMNLNLTLMFHEAFHMIYDEQSLDVKKMIAEWFRQNKSRYSKYAELLFNEAITTALSSGYLYNILNKAPMDTAKWYNNKYIGSMAVALYEKSLEYLQGNKKIDSLFINYYIHLYETKFPQWIREMDNILGDRFIISESGDNYKLVRRAFRFRNIDEFSDKVSFQTLSKLKATPITKVIILSGNRQNQIELIKQAFPELKNWHPQSKADFSFARFLPDKTYLIIVNPIQQLAVNLIKEVTLKPG